MAACGLLTDVAFDSSLGRFPSCCSVSHSAIPETETAAVDPSPSGLEAGVSPPTVRVAEVGRGVALAIIATVAAVFALERAQSLLMSLLPGILFGYTVNPLVLWLERIRTPRVADTSMVMAGVVNTRVLGTCSLRGQVHAILDKLPEAVSKLSARLADLRKGQGNTVERVQTAASDIEEATSQTAGATSTARQPWCCS